MAHRRPVLPLVLLAALFVLAGGYVHLTEWLDVYRDVPSSVPGAEVVTIGFPVNVALSVLAAVALLGALGRGRRTFIVVALLVAAFQAGSLTALVVSRTGSLFGWQEPTWNAAAEQARAVEIGALVLLVAVIGLVSGDPERRRATSS